MGGTRVAIIVLITTVGVAQAASAVGFQLPRGACRALPGTAQNPLGLPQSANQNNIGQIARDSMGGLWISAPMGEGHYAWLPYQGEGGDGSDFPLRGADAERGERTNGHFPACGRERPT